MNTINAEEILIPLIKCRCRSFSRIFPAQTQSPIQTRSHLATTMFRIAKIRASLTAVACKTLVHALVISRVDYGNALLYGITDRLLHRLEMIQHSAARIIMCIKRHDRQSITAVLRHLHWLPVKWRINYKIVVLVFRALHGLAPAYVSTLITPYEPRRALRSAGSAQLCVPRHNFLCVTSVTKARPTA